jgi:plastocyanin
MKKRLIFIFLTLFLVFSAASCSSSNNTQSGGSSTGAGGQGTTVSIENFAFNPQVLTVKAGSTVTWTNKDSVVHNIKSTEFTSPDLKQGETYQHTFDKAGTYEYTCGVHPAMTGKIIVQ